MYAEQNTIITFNNAMYIYMYNVHVFSHLQGYWQSHSGQ